MLILSAILVMAVIAIYYPVHTYVFLTGIDDGGYVYNNTRVLAPLDWEQVKWAFTHSFFLNYDPLTFLAHSINVRLFQLNAGRHHDVNVALHALDVFLLFWLLRRCTGFTARSFMVAALFAVHPVNVENVAWISELKTLLSTAFFLLALGAYHWYASKPKLWRMLGVCFLYGLGLLAKPQVITLPFVLLLWDYWPLRRISIGTQDDSVDPGTKAACRPAKLSWLLIEKIPLLIIAAVDVLLTLHAENKPDLERYTSLIRLGTAIRSYAVYLGKAVWPSGLALHYPHPGYGLRWSEVAAAGLLLLAITAFVIAQRRHRYLPVGWFWFLGTMVPTINLVQIDRNAVADRYAYICFVGLYLIACWGAAEFAQQRHLPRVILPATSGLVLVVLSLVSHRQVGYWRDADTVWTRSLQVTEHNWRVQTEFGRLLVSEGRPDEGLMHFRRGLEDQPHTASDFGSNLLYLAETEHQRGDLRQAIAGYQQALAFSKDRKEKAQIYANMGHAYGALGDSQRALDCYREAQRIRASLSPRQP